jgi:hypothetical protein
VAPSAPQSWRPWRWCWGSRPCSRLSRTAISRRGISPAFGFPGITPRDGGDARLVREESLPPPLASLGLGRWLQVYNQLGRDLTARFVGIRQEEHLRFVIVTIGLGTEMGRMVSQGLLPADTRIAIDCVGAVPYYSRIWTLDRLGLCDARVAHGPWRSGPRILAHGKEALGPYIAAQGIDLVPVHPFNFILSDRSVREVIAMLQTSPPGDDYFLHRLGPDRNFVASFPLGADIAAARFPRLRFVPLLAPGPPRAAAP